MSNTTWKSFRVTDVSSGYTGDGVTPVGTDSIPAGSHSIAKGDSPDKSVDIMVRMLDASGDEVPGPGMTFDVELVELVDDGKTRPLFVVSHSAAVTGVSPYAVTGFSGASWTPRAGAIGVHISNVAGLPGAADRLHVYARDR
jgi:hypothetical protein